MGEKRSFAAAVWKQYGGEIERAVSKYIAEHFRRLDIGTYQIPKPDEVDLTGLALNRVIAYDAPGNKIEFDVIVIAQMDICIVAFDELADEKTEWLRVCCEAVIDGGFSDFVVKGIEVYNYRNNRRRGLLTDTLVPVIYADELEKNAEDILREFYPEALKTPQKIDVRLLAGRMGLSISENRLSRCGTVFGGMIFGDCKVEYYDYELRRYDSLDAEAGTMLVDPEIYFLQTLGNWNNTVTHECVHWRRHRRVFELEKLCAGSAHKIVCRVAEGTTEECGRTDAEWMEWHANSIAPRVLMPRKTFGQKADAYIAFHKQKNHTNRIAGFISAVIADLAEFFGVSLLAAKIRMIDIGYTEAIGVYEYVDDRYIPAYSFREGAINGKQTFSIPAADSLIQYEHNKHFKRVVDSGNYVYIDSHYCINHPDYVRLNQYGVLEMTEYALSHMDECCLVFDRATRPNAEYGVARYTECALFQSAMSKNITEIKYGSNDHNKESEARAAAMRRELSGVQDAVRVLDMLPGSFSKSVVVLMKWRKIKIEELAEKSLLSPRTIQRMRTDHGHKWDIETVIAVCVGMKLPPYISGPLIEKAGLKLKTDDRDITYAHLLMTQYQSPIFEFNEYLAAVGYPPISGIE